MSYNNNQKEKVDKYLVLDYLSSKKQFLKLLKNKNLENSEKIVRDFINKATKAKKIVLVKKIDDYIKAVAHLNEEQRQHYIWWQGRVLKTKYFNAIYYSLNNKGKASKYKKQYREYENQYIRILKQKEQQLISQYEIQSFNNLFTIFDGEKEEDEENDDENYDDDESHQFYLNKHQFKQNLNKSIESQINYQQAQFQSHENLLKCNKKSQHNTPFFTSKSLPQEDKFKNFLSQSTHDLDFQLDSQNKIEINIINNIQQKNNNDKQYKEGEENLSESQESINQIVQVQVQKIPQSKYMLMEKCQLKLNSNYN